MLSTIHAVNDIRDRVKNLYDFPEVAVITGTGLGPLGEELLAPVVIPYREITGFPQATAPSHKGQLIIGKMGDVQVALLQGRLHYYEGYKMDEVTFPIRVLSALGVKKLIVTNAAGSLNERMQTGDIVIISDHINFMGVNPLIGPHDVSFGERFPSMHQPYCPQLIKGFENLAKDLDIPVKQGIYLAVSGPSLETTSECRAFASLGADLVGMSTVPEVIVGVQCGLRILGISVVTNMSNLFHRENHQQSEIQDTAKKALTRISVLINKTVNKVD